MECAFAVTVILRFLGLRWDVPFLLFVSPYLWRLIMFATIHTSVVLAGMGAGRQGLVALQCAGPTGGPKPSRALAHVVCTQPSPPPRAPSPSPPRATLFLCPHRPNMAKDRSHLATALRQSSSWVVSRMCVFGFLAAVVLFSGLFWGLYPAPTPAVIQVNATVAQVENWAAKSAPCTTGGTAFNVTGAPGGYLYHCQGIKLGNPAYFTILVILGALVLMVASYPTDLTMLGCTIIFVASGVLETKDGAVSSCLRLRVFILACGVILLGRDAGGAPSLAASVTSGAVCRSTVRVRWRVSFS